MGSTQEELLAPVMYADNLEDVVDTSFRLDKSVSIAVSRVR